MKSLVSQAWLATIGSVRLGMHQWRLADLAAPCCPSADLSSPHIGSFPPAWLGMEQKLRIASCIASNGSQRYQQPHEGEKCFEADLL